MQAADQLRRALLVPVGSPPVPVATTPPSSMAEVVPINDVEAVKGEHVAGPASPDELDAFFAGDTNVLKSYAFDYDMIIEWEQDMALQELKAQAVNPFGLLCLPLLAYNVGYYYMFTKENIDERIRAQHLALSRDGIRYVVDKYSQRQCCCFPDEIQGKVSKTVPYDKMTDCDVEEPAGYSFVCGCLCPVEQVLSTVQVDTASGAGKMEGGHELSLKGLEAPDVFKKDVWAMKRGETIDGVDGTVAPMAVSMARDGEGGGAGMGGFVGGGGEAVASLAATMRELLEVNKKQLACLLEMKEKGYQAATLAA